VQCSVLQKVTPQADRRKASQKGPDLCCWYWRTSLRSLPETGKSLARCLVQRETPQPSAAKRKAGRKNLRAQALMLASILLVHT